MALDLCAGRRILWNIARSSMGASTPALEAGASGIAIHAWRGYGRSYRHEIASAVSQGGTAVAGTNVIELTDDNWKSEVLESDTPVLVDFWAPWCGPCKAVGPVVEELANDYEGKVKVGKLNVDNARGVATQYQIRSIPTILLIKNGKVLTQRVGAGSKKDLEQILEKAL